MSEVADYIKRAATRCGFKREYYLEKNIPTQPSNVVALPFYGDLRSTFIFSSLILRRFKETNKDKYLVLCSWPGMQGLFPYVDEFWSIEDESVTKGLATEANNFYNTANLATEITRGLAEVLNVVTMRDLKDLYDNGFTQKYWQTYNDIRRFLPEIPSTSKITQEFRSQIERRPGQKLIVYPSAKMRSWQNGKTVSLPVSKSFWAALLDRLIGDGYVPVVYQNQFTYDMSRDFAEKCVYLAPKSFTDALTAFRYVGCVLDVHSGISRMAIAARCPFVAATERKIFVGDKDYEVDDLCCNGVPRQYMFSFSTMLMTGGPDDWKISILDNISAKLNSFQDQLSGAELPSTRESYESVSYDNVRQMKAKRLGVNFIKSSKNK